MPLMSPSESPEVSWEENDVEAFTGEREVFGSDDPASDMEAEDEVSEAKSEVGDTENGVKPNSLKYGWRSAFAADILWSELNTNIFWKYCLVNNLMI